MSRLSRMTAAVDAARAWHAALPEATAFCDWPDDLSWADRPALPGVAEAQLRSNPGASDARALPLVQALQAIAADVEWRQGYSVEQVGQHYLDNHGWFELAGPTGHFVTQKGFITVGYWGPGVTYPRHDHQPEELYTILAGEAVFMSDGDPDATLRTGDSRFHGSSQPHAMITHGSPVLALVFWRGADLTYRQRISA